MEPTRYLGRLEGKTAIVTGAGGSADGVGIGKAIALLFAAEGANVCVVDHAGERADHTVQMIVGRGGRAIACVADVAVDQDCRAAVAAVQDWAGPVQILINNVGIAKSGALDQFEEAEWDRILDVNLKGALLMTRHAVPIMALVGRGSIVNISSIAAISSSGSGLFAYGPSKAALLALTRDIAVRYGRDGVRANSLIPGYIHTPMAVQARGSKGTEMRELRRRLAPIDVEGDGWDVAKAALFLASDESSFITGAQLTVDGGVSALGALKAVELAGDAGAL